MCLILSLYHVSAGASSRLTGADAFSCATSVGERCVPSTIAQWTCFPSVRKPTALFTVPRFYSQSLGLVGGLPPPYDLRRAASWRKYSLPRLAVTEPPLRPNAVAAVDGLAWEIRSSVRARAEESNSRHRAVRFCGNSVVKRIRSASAISLLSVLSSTRVEGIN
jgi:hypothetical protein